MEQYISKSALVAEIDNMLNTKEHTSHSDEVAFNSGRWKALKKVKDILDTLEVKEVIAEQECTCNEAFNRIIGGNWNLLCPVNKLGLKTGDKVKVIIKAQKGE